MNRLASAIIAGGLCLPCSGVAETLTLSLANRTQIESSSMVVNPALGVAEAPLQVYNWDVDGSFSSGLRTRDFDVGSGRDGSFDASTILQFHDGIYNNDGKIRINTSVHPVLEVTNFYLPSGYTLSADGPLVIRSLSEIRIEGTIDCGGGAGAPANSAGTVAPGGTGRCGGTNGGDGGTNSIGAKDGGAASLRQGQAAHNTGSNLGGGGGASPSGNTQLPDPGRDSTSTVTGGLAGVSGNDIAFTVLAGGGGGGGGEGGAGALSGGGGGGGGGTIELYAAKNISVLAGGSVSVRGGDGGGGAVNAAGGGGGGGGSLLLFAAGDISFAGPVLIAEGQGGSTSGGSGGHGGTGRVWVSDPDGVPAGGAFMDYTAGGPAVWGQVQMRSGTFEVVSKLLDLGSTHVTLNSAALDATLGATNTATIEVANAASPFASSVAQWMPLMPGTNGARYARLRLRLTIQDPTQSAVLRSVRLAYDKVKQNEFNYASCQTVHRTPGGPAGPALWIFALALLLPLATVWALKRPLPRKS